MILYIHGFGSSGISSKATILKEELKDFGDVLSPSLSYIPDLAIDTLEQLIVAYKKREDVYLIGTSLGGYFAAYLADKFDIPAVLINPAVNPQKTLQQYIGKSINYYDNSIFHWNQEHMKQLEKYEIIDVKSDLYLLLLQKGDELLDYQEAIDKFSNSKSIVIDGGSHRFENIENYMRHIHSFVQGRSI